MLSEHHPKLHYASLKNAWAGLLLALQTQRNLRLEVLLGSTAVAAALYLGFTATKLMIVIATALLVLSFEMINTSIEAMIDSVHVQENAQAKISKDVAAGALLMITILAGIVGIYLFLPALLDRFW